MRFMHISDLHIGKKLHEISLLKDQQHILREIQYIAKREHVEAVIIAGDIYDKSIPSTAAVELFDEFLFQLAQDKIKVFMISGNHDSPERIAFGGRLMEREGIYVSPVFQGNSQAICVKDSYGELYIHMLPFVKPSHVRVAFPEEEITNYSDAVGIAIRHMNVDTSVRNILISHQFVTGSIRSESEDISIGGSDNVNAEVFAGFDYVALGHIHRAQKAGSDTIRYCGTPLKYSFSEASHEKSVTIVDMVEKGKVGIKLVPVTSLYEMHVIKGLYEDITDTSIYEKYAKDSYMQIILTDEEEIMDVVSKLRVVFPNVLRVEYDNKRTRENQQLDKINDVEEKSPIELFEMLYEKQNNSELKEEQKTYLTKMIEEIWEGDL